MASTRSPLEPIACDGRQQVCYRHSDHATQDDNADDGTDHFEQSQEPGAGVAREAVGAAGLPAAEEDVRRFA